MEEFAAVVDFFSTLSCANALSTRQTPQSWRVNRWLYGQYWIDDSYIQDDLRLSMMTNDCHNFRGWTNLSRVGATAGMAFYSSEKCARAKRKRLWGREGMADQPVRRYWAGPALCPRNGLNYDEALMVYIKGMHLVDQQASSSWANNLLLVEAVSIAVLQMVPGTLHHPIGKSGCLEVLEV